MISKSFQTVQRMREAWKRETYVRSQSLTFESNIPTSGEEGFKYPLPRENKISQMPYPRANKDNQILTSYSAPPVSFTFTGALVALSV